MFKIKSTFSGVELTPIKPTLNIFPTVGPNPSPNSTLYLKMYILNFAFTYILKNKLKNLSMANFAAFTASTPSGILTALTVGTRSTSLCTNISIFIALIPFSNLLDID